MEKLNKTINLILLIALGVFVFLYFNEKFNSENLEDKYLQEKKEDLRKQAEKLNLSFKEKTNSLQFKIDSLKKIERDIRYIPYEKPIYIDRTLDDALRVFSEHPANKRTTNSN